MAAACEPTVECAFGFGPGDDLSAATWVDVTDDVDLSGLADGMVASSGRSGAQGDINPGRLTFKLENHDRQYDPRNADGPHFGDLTPGVPIRVTTVYNGGAAEDRWYGFVEGWPQQLTERRTSIEVSAQDVFGVIAQADAPPTAFSAAVANLELEASEPGNVVELKAWYRTGPAGWVDSVGGRTGRHTGALSTTDPIVNGDAETWGQDGGDGYGILPNPWSTWPTSLFLFLTFRVEPETVSGGGSVALIADEGGRISVEVSATTLTVTSAGPSQGLRLEWDAGLADGKPHTLLVEWLPATVVGGLYVDGRLLADGASTILPGSSAAPGELVVGRGIGAPNYIGALDHLLIVEMTTSWSDVKRLATVDTLHSAALRAWAGQRLDERLEHVLDGAGVGERVGTLDVSGIVTQQSYRAGGPVELLQTIEDTEQGRVWVDRSGQVRFSQRTWAWSDPKSTTVQVTFSDDPDLLDAGTAQEMLVDAVISDDERNVTTVAQVTAENGRMQTALADPAIVARVGRRNPVHLSGLMHAGDARSLAIAQWIVMSMSEPRPKVEALSFLVESDPAVLAPIAQAIEEGWLVKVIKAAPLDDDDAPIGDPVEVLGHVVGITHRWSVAGWRVTLLLDGSRTGWSWFTWGSSTWGNTDGEGWAF